MAAKALPIISKATLTGEDLVELIECGRAPTMDWILKHLLIPDDRLRGAALFRMVVGFIIITLTVAACRSGWSSSGNGYGITGLNALILLIFSGIARRWRRETGMWMMYSLLTALSLLMYGLAMGMQYGAPAPSATPAYVAASNNDAYIASWVCFMNVRLQVSAAVANFRRFRVRTGPDADRPA